MGPMTSIEELVGKFSQNGYKPEVIDFATFLERVKENPGRHLRTGIQYLRDTIDHFGSKRAEEYGVPLRIYNIFDAVFEALPGESQGSRRVIGNLEVKSQLVNNIRSVAGSGKGRIVVLEGPVGNGKTSLVRLLMRGMEHYSLTEAGALYSHSWVIDTSATSKMGFQMKPAKDKNARKPDKEVIFPCPLNDHPLLVLPQNIRMQVLHNLVPNLRETVPMKFLEGDACQNCAAIREHLYVDHEGNWNEVLQHLRIRRFRLDELRGVGLATVDPIPNPEAEQQLMTFEDELYKDIRDKYPGIRLSLLGGKWVHANRGIIHFSDMFKRHEGLLVHLLSGVEGFVDLGGSRAFVDSVIIGTSNTEEWVNFNEIPQHGAFRDRSIRQEVTYLLNHTEEEEMYRMLLGVQGFSRDNEDHHYHPLLSSSAALWAVLTRLNQPFPKNSEEAWRKFVEEHREYKKLDPSTLDPLTKAKIYAGQFDEKFMEAVDNPRLSAALQKAIFLRYLRHERPDEGRVGVSPRTMENVFSDLARIDEETTCIDAIQFLEWCKRLERDDAAETYPFLNDLTGKEEEDGDIEKGHVYSHLRSLNVVLEAEFKRNLRNHALTALLGIDDERINDMFMEYVSLLSAQQQGLERFEPNPHYFVVLQPEKEIEVSSKRIQQFEQYMGWKGLKRKTLRAALFHDIHTYTQRSGKKVLGRADYLHLFKDKINIVRRALYEEELQQLEVSAVELAQGLARFGEESFKGLSVNVRGHVTDWVDRMKGKFGYCTSCALSSLNYAIRENLIFKENEF